MSLLSVLNKIESTKSTKSTRSSSSSSVANSSSRYVNSVKKIGQVKPLQSPGLAVDVKPNVVIVDTTSRDYRLLIKGILSKYPHYEFVCKVKSGQLNKIRYWFKNTKNNVTVIFGYKDMEKELRLSLHTTLRLQEQGIEEKDTEQFVPSYCLFDTVPISQKKLLELKYRLYKLSKYNDLEPFYTKFSIVDKIGYYEQKFDYKEAKVHSTESEVIEEKEEAIKYLGETGTGLKSVGNGFFTI